MILGQMMITGFNTSQNKFIRNTFGNIRHSLREAGEVRN